MAEEKKKTEQKEKSQGKAPAKVSDTAKKTTAKKPAEKNLETKVVTEVMAKARFIKISPRKTRLVLDQIRGLKVENAADHLKFINKAAVAPITKLLNSAVANAKNNFDIDKKDLFVKAVTADEGPTLKRYRPRAHGRSAMIRKKTSHINLILGVQDGAAKAVAKKPKASDEVKIVSPDEVKKEGKDEHSDSSDKGGPAQGKSDKGFMKGVFQRKTG